MIIGNQQMAKLDRAVFNDFIMAMVIHIREIFSDTVVESDEYLHGEIRNWIRQSAKYGIETQADIEGYIDLCYCCESMRTEPKPWVIRNVLYHHELEPWEKIDYLYDRIIIKDEPEFTGGQERQDTIDDEIFTIV